MAESGIRKEGRKKLSIEQYIDFAQGRDASDLTNQQLCEISAMHGFKKRYKGSKKSLEEALSKLELMDLARSTAQNAGVSSCAHLTLEEAIKALEDLEWQECHVSSLVTVNACAVGDSAVTPTIKPSRQRSKRKSEKKAAAAAKDMGEDRDDSIAPTPSNAIAATPITAVSEGIPPSPASVATCASLIGGKKAQQPKRKRKKQKDGSTALKPRNVTAKKGTTTVAAVKGTTSPLVGSVATCPPVIGCGENDVMK